MFGDNIFSDYVNDMKKMVDFVAAQNAIHKDKVIEVLSNAIQQFELEKELIQKNEIPLTDLLKACDYNESWFIQSLSKYSSMAIRGIDYLLTFYVVKKPNEFSGKEAWFAKKIEKFCGDVDSAASECKNRCDQYQIIQEEIKNHEWSSCKEKGNSQDYRVEDEIMEDEINLQTEISKYLNEKYIHFKWFMPVFNSYYGGDTTNKFKIHNDKLLVSIFKSDLHLCFHCINVSILLLAFDIELIA